MPSFAELLAQAEAAGVLTGRSEILPAGTYNLYVESAKPKKTKKGDPSISIRWKSDAGQVAYHNLNFIPGEQVGQAITLSTLVDLGVTRDYLARVDVSQGLEAIVPELIRVTQGRWFVVDVTVKKNGEYTNNNFFIKTGANAQAAAAPVAPVAVPQVAPVYIPQPQQIAAPAPVAVPQPQFIPQPAPAPVMQPVPQPQAPAYVPQPIPQPASIPQPAQTDPATGLPPRPGV